MEGRTVKNNLKAAKGRITGGLTIEVSHTKIESTVKYVEGSRYFSQRYWIIWCIQEKSGMEFLEEADSSAEKLAPGPSQSAICAPVDEV
jgi:hypothetical protein